MRIGKRHPRDRRGATTVESALAYSVAMVLIMGIMITGLGVFRYQQLASLSRAGARWASVHGPQYQSDQGNSSITKGVPITSADVMTNGIVPRMVGLNAADLTCTLTMPSGSDSASTGTTTVSADGTAVTSTTSNVPLNNPPYYSGCATVTLSYQWTPEGFFSPITMTSTSVVPVTY